jgi:hypothetical protein
MNVAIEQAADNLATLVAVPRLVRWLQDALGQRLVAAIAGASHAQAIGERARGRRAPHLEAERWLRHSFRITQSTEAAICEAMAGNFCRCAGYFQIVEGIAAATRPRRRAGPRDMMGSPAQLPSATSYLGPS